MKLNALRFKKLRI